jgi:hypothetical protein
MNIVDATVAAPKSQNKKVQSSVEYAKVDMAAKFHGHGLDPER